MNESPSPKFLYYLMVFLTGVFFAFIINCISGLNELDKKIDQINVKVDNLEKIEKYIEDKHD